jgi:hypothetical protein
MCQSHYIWQNLKWGFTILHCKECDTEHQAVSKKLTQTITINLKILKSYLYFRRDIIFASWQNILVIISGTRIDTTLCSSLRFCISDKRMAFKMFLNNTVLTRWHKSLLCHTSSVLYIGHTLGEHSLG